MKRSPFLLSTFLLLGLFCADLPAQQHGLTWLTTKDGLSQGFVSALLQDREGFIWAGTKNGLNRYDGYRFEVFTKDPYEEFSLSNDYIQSLCEYGNFIIVGTEWGGINLLHKKTRRVYRLHCEMPLFSVPLGQCNVNWVAVDASGNIWAEIIEPNPVQEFWRMCKISIPPEFWENPPTNNDWQKKITLKAWPQNLFTIPYIHSDGKFILAPGPEGIFEINTESLQWTLIVPPHPPEKKDMGTMIQHDGHGRFWMVRRFSQGIRLTADVYCYQRDLQENQAGFLQPIALDQENLALQHIAHGFAWLNFGGEIRGHRVGNNGDIDFGRPDIVGIQLPEGSLSSLTDRSGIVWLGTNGLGIAKLNLQSKRFQHLLVGESICNTILRGRNAQIISFNNKFELLYHPALAPNSLVPQFRNLADISMTQDREGTCWITGRTGWGYDWVLKKIDPTGALRLYTIPTNQPEPIPLLLDANGDPWLGGAGSLMHFDQREERFSQYDFRKVIPAPHNVYSLAHTADGSCWLATRNGLLCGKPVEGSTENFEFEWLKNELSTRNSLSSNFVASLLTDPNDPYVLWIGTKGGGLDRLDVRTRQFTHLSTREGLPNNVIYGVLAESDPSPASGTILWLSSNKGLIRYIPSTGAIKNYTEEDGVQANEFNTYAYGKGPTGEMLFGGVNGMTVFHPRQLLEDTLAPRTLITSLRLNDCDVSWNDSTGILTQGIEFTTAITVPFSRNNLTLEFVALSYASPEKNRFRYYLEGAESEWVHESKEHSASYLNLAPGTYTFRVIGSNSEGVWSRQPAALKITVLPPWYRTWLAWLAYVLILGGSAYAFYRYQLRTKLEHAENERLKELDAFKSRFFTNITHEFRTPLTVILGMAERLEKNEKGKEEKTSALQLIRRNGQNLLRLINEILDLAKLESNKLQMDYVQGDVLAYLKYITENLHSLANTKNVLLRLESEQAKIVMDYDPERLLQIVHNLLSNAIKFTPGGGRVSLRAELPGSYLQIVVADTGVGIPPEDLPHVFERFYQAENQEHSKAGGTGVGLSLTRELVKAMGGDITVESTLGKGSVFTLRLPVTNKAPMEEMQNLEWRSPDSTFPDKAKIGVPHSASPISNSELPTMLIIEDNPDVVEYLSGCLRGRYQLDFAYNGRAGIEKALENIPDIIVSDVMMPEKDGFEVCDVLKNDERTSHIPIVLLTARATVEDRIAGLQRGADAYLAKPFNLEELTATLENLTKIRARLLARYANGQVPAPTEDRGLQIEDAFLTKVRAVVEDNLSDSDFEMPHLQRKMAMSHSQIFRKLKALTGKSPSQFIRSIRLAKAREMLASTDLTVSEIAYDTGFSSLQYFSDAFFEEFGQRPSAMRN